MKRSDRNPILTRLDIPPVTPDLADVSSVFNPGAIKIYGNYFLLLRVQTRGRETALMLAHSPDGEKFSVLHETVKIKGIENIHQKIYHIYDPRLTQIDNLIYMVFAADTDGGCHLGIAASENLKIFELVSFDAENDSRNGVLFPEIVNGKYLRLERPNKVRLNDGPASGSEIFLSESDDLVNWQSTKSIMSGRFHYWDELIGSGPPPVKTRDGWLHIYHGIATHFQSSNIYQAGAILLDLEDPSKVIARTKNNILEPREIYELTGQVPNVVFPSGMIVEDIDSSGFAEMESSVKILLWRRRYGSRAGNIDNQGAD
jgi:beta-1,4-mannooligosaccharide/beta-1,4-mannosyl-N-acetylglucosamine phosphorylase